MKIIAIEDCGNCFTGIIETKETYRAFQLFENDRLTLTQTYPKERYKDLEHFRGVMGKFDPYVLFLKTPIEVELPTFDAVRKLIKSKGGSK